MPKITIQEIQPLNHDVRRIVTDKPEGCEFTPGQATLVAIDKEFLAKHVDDFGLFFCPRRPKE